MKKTVYMIVLIFSISVSTLLLAATAVPAGQNKVFITDAEKSDFLKAAQEGNLTRIREMHVSMPEIIRTTDKDEWTALLYAARFGRLNVVKYLLENGANVNEMDVDRYTALHHAAAFGHKNICEYLLKKGAKVNARTKGAVTPRRLAETNGHAATADFLEGKRGVR